MQPLTKEFTPFAEVALILGLLLLLWMAGCARGHLLATFTALLAAALFPLMIFAAFVVIIGAAAMSVWSCWCGKKQEKISRNGLPEWFVLPFEDDEEDESRFNEDQHVPGREEEEGEEKDDEEKAREDDEAGEEEQEEKGDGENCLVVTAAQAINFSVSAITSASTTLLACTDELPNSASSLLIIDATVQCYEWWQYVLMGLLVLVVLVVSAPLVAEASFRCIVGVAAPEHVLLRYDAIRSVTNLAKAPFKPECWFWLGILILQRIVLGVIQALPFLTATSRALWSATVCGVFFGLQTRLHPFKIETHNAAQTMLLFCAMIVAVMNVSSATLSTNAMSTSSAMDHEVDTLVVTEAALLFVPICVVAAWQLFVFHNDLRAAFTAATVAVASTASKALEAISGLYLSYMARCRACIGSLGLRRSASVEVDDSLGKSLLAEGGSASEAEVESLAIGSYHDQ